MISVGRLSMLTAGRALSAQEFEDAKHALLHPRPPVSGDLNASATEYFERRNRAAGYRLVWNVIVAVIFIIIVLTVIGQH